MRACSKIIRPSIRFRCGAVRYSAARRRNYGDCKPFRECAPQTDHIELRRMKTICLFSRRGLQYATIQGYPAADACFHGKPLRIANSVSTSEDTKHAKNHVVQTCFSDCVSGNPDVSSVMVESFRSRRNEFHLYSFTEYENWRLCPTQLRQLGRKHIVGLPSRWRSVHLRP
jgi:hypothetical protein